MLDREIDLSHVLDYRGRHAHPHYATRSAAGLDLTANIPGEMVLHPGRRLQVPTGLWLNLPADFEMQIRPRSGMAILDGVTVLNSPGTIDADYDNEVSVILINLGSQLYVIRPGQKIAQGVLGPVYRTAQGFTKDTKERAGGFGSTGL